MKFVKLKSEKEMSHDEWLELRKSGIGGSDAAAVVGLSKYKSPYMLYLDKLSLHTDEITSECTYWGNVLEQVVADEFAKRSGKKVRNNHFTMRSVEYPYMLANVDREIVGENALLECKTANEYLKDEWKGDEVPTAYLIQCQHYMAVTGAERVYIACLVGGNKFISKTIERDDELISWLIEEEGKFWQTVQDREPPAFSGIEAESKFIEQTYSDDEVCGVAHFNFEEDSIIQRLIELKGMKSDIDKKIKIEENALKAKIGSCECGVGSHYRVNWKSINSTRFDSKAFKKDNFALYNQYAKTTTSRRFEIKEIN